MKKIHPLLIAFCAVAFLCGASPVATPPAQDDMVYGGVWAEPGSIIIPPEQMAFSERHSEDARSISEAESNTYLCVFDGWVMAAQVLVGKYGPLRIWGSYILLVGPDGKRYYVKRQFKEKDVKLAKDRLFLQEGGNLIEGKNGVFRLKLVFDTISCDLTYKNIVPSWKPGNGHVYLDKEKKISSFLVVTSPWADVTGTIRLPDRTLNVKGEGYADKAVGTQTPFKQNPYLFSIRVFSPPGTPKEQRWMFCLLESTTHTSFGSKKIPLLYLCNNNKMILATKNYEREVTQWKKGAQADQRYPGVIKIHAEGNGYAIKGEYVGGKLFDVLNVFSELPAWWRSIAEKFGKAMVHYRSHGTLNATVTSPDGKTTNIRLIGPTGYLIVK